MRPGWRRSRRSATGAVATVWSSAVVAEVNPLHLALMALLIHRSLVWADEHRLRDLALGGLLVGLGLGNHLLTAFVAPFFVLFALWAGRHALREKPAWLLAPVARRASPGARVYLYIPIAALGNPPLPVQPPDHARRHPVPRHGRAVPRPVRRPVHDLRASARSLSSFGDLAQLVAARATPVFPILGLVGLVLLLRRRPAFGLACWGALIAGIDVWANYLHLEHYLLVPVAAARDRRRRRARRGRDGVTRVLAGRRVDRAARSSVAGGARGDRSRSRSWSRTCPLANRHDDRSAPGLRRRDGRPAPAERGDLSYWAVVAAAVVRDRSWRACGRTSSSSTTPTSCTRAGARASAGSTPLICDRPVFVMRPNDAELNPTRAAYTLTEAFRVYVGRGTPYAVQSVPVYRVEPPPGRCPAA